VISIAPKCHSRFTRRSLLLAAGAGAAGGFAIAAQPATARASLAGRILPVGAPGGLFVGLQSYPQTLALADGEVVLTLDDGPLPGPTDRVLDAIGAYGASATFFLIGRNAVTAPGLVRRMAAEGHTVAHHTMHHPWTLRQRSVEVGIREIEQGIAAVDGALGRAAASAPFFRYPGFAGTPQLDAWLAGRNMAVFGADLWASDWTAMSPDRQLSLVMGRLSRARKGIILLHDVVGQTAAMFPAFLGALAAGGYRVVSLVPGSAAPATVTARPGWRSRTDQLIAQRKAGASR
jgi:peptidoglycan-N-acetylglucosamine deacetylase